MVKGDHAARLALIAFSAGCSLVTGFDDLDPSLESCLPGTTRACYEGADDTNGVGTCTGGVATCSDDGSGYGPCIGQVLPAGDDCTTSADESCGTENTCGGGGSGATTGATSSVSTGCQPDCGPNKRCGDDGCGSLCNGVEMPPTFWVDQLGGDVTNLEPWPETQSLFVTTSADEIFRVDLCDGSILAQTSMNGVEGLALPSIDVVGRVDDVLLAVGVQTGSAAALAGFEAEALALLDSAPLPFGFNGGLADTTPVADRFVAVHADNGTASSVGMQGSCSLPVAASGWKGRGIAFDGNETFYLMANSTPTMRFYAACADLCACSAGDVRTGLNLVQNFHLFDIGWTGSRLVVAGYRNITGDPAVLAAVDGPALAAAAELRIFQGAGIDVFTSVTGHGGFVFAGGAAGTANTSNISGIGWLVRVPETFTNATSEADIITASIALTQRISRVAADDTGVYAGGLSELDGGFVTKCTHDLSACGMP